MKKTRPFLLLVLFLCGTHSIYAQIPNNTPYVPNQLIIWFKPGTSPQTIKALRNEYHAKQIDSVPCIPNLYLWQLPEGSNVDTIRGNAIGKPGASSGSPNYITTPLINNSGCERNECVTENAALCPITAMKRVKVGFIDTGLDGFTGTSFSSANHPNLLSPFQANLKGMNFISNIQSPQDDHRNTAGLLSGHGTHVLGIAAKKMSAYGIQPFVDLRVYKTLGADGFGELFDIIKAIGEAICDNVNILNMSVNWTERITTDPSLMEKVIDYAGIKDILIVASAGNDGQNVDATSANTFRICPTAYKSANLIVVNAIDCNTNTEAIFSNKGVVNVDITAPGVNIPSILIGAHNTGFMSGTSMAAPYITAQATLLATLNAAAFDFAAIKQAILKTAAPKGFTTVTGGTPQFCQSFQNICSATPAPTASVTIQPTCSAPTGTITITANSVLYDFSFDNGATYQTSNIKSGLQSGYYNVRIKNKVTGCVSYPNKLTLNQLPPSPATPTGNVTYPQPIHSSGTITITAPTTGVDYSFDNGATYQASRIKSGLSVGVYTVKVKAIATGCISTAKNFTVNSNVISTDIVVLKNTFETKAVENKAVEKEKTPYSEDFTDSFVTPVKNEATSLTSREKNLKIFPNPAFEEAWIDLRAYEGLPINIHCYNSLGSLMRHERIQEGDIKTYRFDVKGLATGTYYIYIQTKDKPIERVRFVVVH